MSQQFMKILYEWSMRNQTKDQVEITEIDPEKLKWLADAFDNIFTDGATLLRNCIEIINSDKDLQTKIEVLVNMEDLVENIDNAMVLKNLNGWKCLFSHYDSGLEVNILQTVSAAVRADATILSHAISDGLFDFLKLTIDNYKTEIEKPLLGLVSAIVLNHSSCMLLQFNPLLKFKSSQQPRYQHVKDTVKLMKEAGDDKKWVDKILTWLAE